MEWLIGELVALGGPAYVFLQLLMGVRYRGGWRIAALVPLLVMVPLAGLAYWAGPPAWPVLPVLVAPAAFVYLVLVGVAKAVAGSPAAKKGAN